MELLKFKRMDKTYIVTPDRCGSAHHPDMGWSHCRFLLLKEEEKMNTTTPLRIGSIHRVAGYLRSQGIMISEYAIRQWIAAGMISCSTVGTTTYVDAEKVEKCARGILDDDEAS